MVGEGDQLYSFCIFLEFSRSRLAKTLVLICVSFFLFISHIIQLTLLFSFAFSSGGKTLFMVGEEAIISTVSGST